MLEDTLDDVRVVVPVEDQLVLLAVKVAVVIEVVVVVVPRSRGLLAALSL